jgi:hypothetical protein
MGEAVALSSVRSTHVVGREAERARTDAFAAAVPEGSRALIVRGESGIGKTTIWRYGVVLCRRAGFTVLVTRPAEEEMPLALVGLLDLFEQVEVDAAAFRADDDRSPVAAPSSMRCGAWPRAGPRWWRSTTPSGSTRPLRAL